MKGLSPSEMKGVQEEETVYLRVEDGEVQPKDESVKDKDALIYGVEDTPSIFMTFFIALQQVAMSISGSIAVPLIVSELMCMAPYSTGRAHIVCTFLFMCGVSTVLQCTLGVRLPIIQGGCGKFIPAIATLMTLEKLQCVPVSSSIVLQGNGSFNQSNSSILDGEDTSWLIRIREIQGGIIMASLTEFLLAFTGVMGIMLRFISPITIMPTITLVGLSLFELAANLCQVHWGISSLTIILILLFSLYLNNVYVPLPSFSFKRRCHISRLYIFKLFPLVLAVAISWMLCWVLTATDVLPDNPDDIRYQARTDANLESLYRMPWFYVPYPGQWGVPTISIPGYLGMLAATLTSMVESIGDYYACANSCQLPPPPAHAMNRGIAMEGLGGMLSGIFGSGGSTTSYSQNVGAIGFTKAASRRAFQVAGLIFMGCGIFGKFGAVMTLLPKPVLGAVLLIGLSMVAAVGISNLQHVNMSSSRNQCIVGLSLMLGMVIPTWSTKNPEATSTGNLELDQSIRVLLQTSMFVGGFIACILDNTVPGTPEERGMLHMIEPRVNKRQDVPNSGQFTVSNSKHCVTYDLPFVTRWLKTQNWARYIPVLPTFKEDVYTVRCRRSKA